jgi:electron transport complex protein RnfD
MEQPLLLSSSPHLRDSDSISRIMWSVVVALVPAVAISIYFFGWNALLTYAFSIVTAEAAEVIFLRIRKQPVEHALDGSAMITGILTAMVLPPLSPHTHWYCPVVASVFAIAIAKHCFGGLGNNVWNPALAGRVFVQFAYPSEVTMSAWPSPRPLFGAAQAAADATTQATPLFKEAPVHPNHLDLFLGNGIAGSLGETCKLALLIGGLYLILRKRVDWRVPLFYIGTVFVLTAVLPPKGGHPAPWAHDPLYHILSGGLFLGAFFMATDMVTTPVTSLGRIIFATGCGLLCVLIRLYGGYPEGVAYSILLMNCFTPLIDRCCKPRIYGSKTPKPTPKQP